MVQERQSQMAISDTSDLSSFSLSQLPIDKSGPPTVVHGIDVPLSTSILIHTPTGNQYPHIWAVLSKLLETQDVSTSYMQPMHDYYNQCYETRMEEYMMNPGKASERAKNNMYNNTLDGVSNKLLQSVPDIQPQLTRQQDANAENCTRLPYYPHFNDMLTGYNVWSTDI